MQFLEEKRFPEEFVKRMKDLRAGLEAGGLGISIKDYTKKPEVGLWDFTGDMQTVTQKIKIQSEIESFYVVLTRDGNEIGKIGKIMVINLTSPLSQSFR